MPNDLVHIVGPFLYPATHHRSQRLAQCDPVYAYRFEGERFDTVDCAGYVREVVATGLSRSDLADDLRVWLSAQFMQHLSITIHS